MEPIVEHIQACNLKCLENEQVQSCSRFGLGNASVSQNRARTVALGTLDAGIPLGKPQPAHRGCCAAGGTTASRQQRHRWAYCLLSLSNNVPLFVLQDARRLGPMHKAPDPRVDVCIYFISPHR